MFWPRMVGCLGVGSSGGHRSPDRKGTRAQESVVLGSELVASDSEEIVDHAMEGKKPLRLMSRLEATHLSFSEIASQQKFVAVEQYPGGARGGELEPLSR